MCLCLCFVRLDKRRGCDLFGLGYIRTLLFMPYTVYSIFEVLTYIHMGLSIIVGQGNMALTICAGPPSFLVFDDNNSKSDFFHEFTDSKSVRFRKEVLIRNSCVI